MDLNATLFGQIITFALFIWFTLRFVWPPITQAMHQRKETIAAGLAAAERGKHELELAQHKAKEMLRDAKIQAAAIIESANQRASHLIEEAKQQARHESDRLLALGKSEIDNELQKAKLTLKNKVATLAINGAEKLLERNIDKAVNSELLDKLMTEI